MNKEVYDEFNQPVYRQQLPTGLSLQMIPMSGYHKTYAIFTTDFGSIDNHFVPYGKKNAIQVPDGIAHFLEHKMFERLITMHLIYSENLVLIQMPLQVLPKQATSFLLPIMFGKV